MDSDLTPADSATLHGRSNEASRAKLSSAPAEPAGTGTMDSSNAKIQIKRVLHSVLPSYAVIPDDGYIHHRSLEELRGDKLQPENWTATQMTMGRVKLVNNPIKPPGLSQEVETMLKSSDPSVSPDASANVKALAKAQKNIAPLTNEPFSAEIQRPVRRFYETVFEFYFGICYCTTDIHLKVPGGKIIPWCPDAIVGTNLCKAGASHSDKPNIYEDVAYLLSFAQATGSRTPYLLSSHGFGRIFLLKADINETYMTALNKADMKDVRESLEVELVGNWNMMKEKDRIEYVAMMADLSKQFGSDNAENHGKGN